MFRVLFIMLFLSAPLLAQGGVSFGVHGCGAWSKLKMGQDDFTIETDDYSQFWGGRCGYNFQTGIVANRY